MILSQTTPRCPGRQVGILGSATFARECRDCVRRTDVPADMQSVPWMVPPKILPNRSMCDKYMAPEEDDAYAGWFA